MRILFLYYNHNLHDSLVPIYFVRAFRSLGHEVVTCGRSGEKAQDSLDIKLDSFYVPLEEILNKAKKAKFEPDLIFLYYPSTQFLVLNIENSPIPTAVYVIDTPNYFLRTLLKGYVLLFDYIFCAQKDFFEELKTGGLKNVWWCTFACDSTIHKNYNCNKKNDLVFLGSITPLHNPRRWIYLKILEKKFNLKLGKNMYFEKMAKLYSQTKIIFNLPPSYELNPRLFEGMACGSLVLTPCYQMGVNDLFKNKKHFVTYKNLWDLLNKINFYLKNEKDREYITHQGEKLVLKNHSYLNRVHQILNAVNKGKGSRKNGFEPDKSFAIAKSYYLVGLLKEAKFWGKRALSSQNINNPIKIKARLLILAVDIGGNFLSSKIATFLGRLAGTRSLLYQLTHF